MTRRKLVALFAVLLGVSSVLSGCGFKGLYSASLPGGADLGSHPFTVSIEFADVLDLVPQSAVKVNDVAIGKVTAISLGNDRGKWVANVDVEINASVQLPQNARASVMQTSLLGEKYISLMPPSRQPSGTRLANHDKIPISATNSAAGVEQVLGALSLLLNEGGLRQIKAIATELNKALGTKERQRATRDLLGQLNTFVGTLDDQKDGITNALEQIDKLASTLNRNKGVLTDALDRFPAALKALDQERGKLVDLLKSLSNLGVVANRVIDSTQSSLVSALNNLDPAIRALTKSGDDLPGALRIAGTFPFPLGITRQIVKGDYANLDAIFNLNLTDTLCGLIGLCVGGASGGALQTAAPILKVLLPILFPGSSPLSKGAKTQSKKAAPLSSMLVGAGK